MDQKQRLRPEAGFTRWVVASGIMLLSMAAAPSYDGPPNDGQPFCPPGRTCATSQTASDCGSCCDTNVQCTACCGGLGLLPWELQICLGYCQLLP